MDDELDVDETLETELMDDSDEELTSWSDDELLLDGGRELLLDSDDEPASLALELDEAPWLLEPVDKLLLDVELLPGDELFRLELDTRMILLALLDRALLEDLDDEDDILRLDDCGGELAWLDADDATALLMLELDGRALLLLRLLEDESDDDKDDRLCPIELDEVGRGLLESWLVLPLPPQAVSPDKTNTAMPMDDRRSLLKQKRIMSIPGSTLHLLLSVKVYRYAKKTPSRRNHDNGRGGNLAGRYGFVV